MVFVGRCLHIGVIFAISLVLLSKSCVFKWSCLHIGVALAADIPVFWGVLLPLVSATSSYS